MDEKTKARFWSKVNRGGPDECWEWQAYRITQRGGYGHIRWKVDGRWAMVRAHRVAWELTHGPAGDLGVLHACDNPPCCNPAHLFLGTQQSNMRDKIRKGRHLRGEQAPGARLTADDVRRIRRLYANGNISQRAIAERYAVGQGLISMIILRKRWAHIE